MAAACAAEAVVPNYVDLVKAQKSRVVKFPGLIGPSDLEQVMACHQAAAEAGDPLVTNPQNKQHKRKRCTFLHGDSLPDGARLLSKAPRVLAKLVRAAVAAQADGCWGCADSSDAVPEEAGPLLGIDCRKLSIRVVELWEYEVGGGLVDDHHFDAGSIVTIVCLLNDDKDFTGGVFRTFEASGEHEEHHLSCGDVICFVSHKYHNITPVLSGQRKSLVVELWQGGLPMWCR
eukprot:gb/GFBE01079287.1/.p1 GENE.gb/GFBE01079287.1/~~gb/GFBE01079287.1/.p1  ORF type:complete len:231 (+),score=60.93 gb/GFBE01079287.1/:1-693(+)